MSLINELRRRNVIRVAVAYIILSWLLLQVADVVFEFLEVPGWAGKLLIGLLALGFVPTVVFAWAFELTPSGIKRAEDVDPSQSITPETGRKLDYITMGMVILGVAFLLADRFLLEPRSAVETPSAGFEGDRATSRSVPGGRTAEAGQASIAVLPFADLSPEGDQEYFADGISEELLNVLVGIDGLKVASRTSSFAYKGLNKNIADIATDLKVDHVLEGSVRKAQNRIRITAQLIDAATDRHLWSQTYDRELDDIFAIQEDIAKAILVALQDVLGIDDPDAAVNVSAKTHNLDAYALYLEGRELFHKRQDLERAVATLERSVELDPQFARGWEQLAAVYGIMESWRFTERPYNRLAVEAADQALELDPTLSMPYAVKGNVAFETDQDWGKSFEYLDAAVRADPRNASAHLWIAINWIQLGYFDRAQAAAQRCLEIDPAYGNCIKRVALIALLRGEDEQALEAFFQAELGDNRSLTARFLPLLLRSGHRYAAYLLITGNLADRMDSSELPVRSTLDALAGVPLGEKEREVVLAAASGKGAFPGVINMSLGNFDAISFGRSYGGILWQPEFPAFMRSAAFKRGAAELKAPEFWRKHGFPPQCRPIGEDDYECSMP